MDVRAIPVVVAMLLFAFESAGSAQSPQDKPVKESAKPNLAVLTLGGPQLWGDELVLRDWRIQRNVVTGHYRLLDGRNVRHAWGTFEVCRGKLEEIRQQRKLPAIEGKVVLVLHGLGRTRGSMGKLCSYLEKNGGYTVLSVGYPSTRASVSEHAAALAQIVAYLDGAEEINFVGHSLGNLVIRHYLADETDEKTRSKPDPRIRRIVMLAPPNQGSSRAEDWSESRLFKLVLGPSGQQLAKDWATLEGQLATPSCEFGILAGGRGDDRGWNRSISGDDDGIVSVATTRLAGARDFAVLPVLHTFIMTNETSLEYTLRFLEKGYFAADERRNPIPTGGEDGP